MITALLQDRKIPNNDKTGDWRYKKKHAGHKLRVDEMQIGWKEKDSISTPYIASIPFSYCLAPPPPPKIEFEESVAIEFIFTLLYSACSKDSFKPNFVEVGTDLL